MLGVKRIAFQFPPTAYALKFQKCSSQKGQKIVCSFLGALFLREITPVIATFFVEK